MGGVPFPEPFWDGPPVPLYNTTHDARVEAWRQERWKREAEQERLEKEAELKIKQAASN